MKLKFDSTLEYQQQAVNAVVGVFDGLPIAQSSFEFSATVGDGFEFSEFGYGNKVELDNNKLLKNVLRIQEANGINQVNELDGRQFSVEMETGTGKTYVYLRSIFELSRKYGLKKFVIVVPNVAIREGVLKTIQITKDHFRLLYDNEPFEYFVYDSKNISRVRQFAVSNQIQIMLINIQSFQKDAAENFNLSEMSHIELQKLNVIYRENDKMSGYKPIEFIQATKPIVIIDEPQSVDNTPIAKNAIAKLNAEITLRFSATHINQYNLLYKLDPIQAYDLRLVKRIEIASVSSDDTTSDAYVKLLKTDNRNGIKAQIEIYKLTGGSVSKKKFWVKSGDDLFDKSGKHEIYLEGYIVQKIRCTPGNELIEFSSGKALESGGVVGGMTDEIMKTQVYETVERHLEKECFFRGKHIKVLSLFFIDRVANYRIYNEDGTTSLGKFGKWFEEAYVTLTSEKDRYKGFNVEDVSKIHDGYFAKDKRGHAKDSIRGNSKDDLKAYQLIMQEKERLLDPLQPLRFIFSHSALREGWDNPNVFQICTLNETQSPLKKRQEIGRGLRLPVNSQGERIHDEDINQLTIVANESYKNFAKSLQTEFENDLGIKFGHITKFTFASITRKQGDRTDEPIGPEESKRIYIQLESEGYINGKGKILDKFDPGYRYFDLKIGNEFDDIKSEIVDEMKRFVFSNRIVSARKRRTIKFNKQVHLSPEFFDLWNKIKQKTRYRVSFESDDLIRLSVERIKAMNDIAPIKTNIVTTAVEITERGILGDSHEHKVGDPVLVSALPDLLLYLQKETELTRHTLVEIIVQSGRLEEFRRNPQQYMESIAREIKSALQCLMLDGIQYEKNAGQYWEMNRIESEAEKGLVRYLNSLVEIKNQEKCLFDAVEFESEVEKQFAMDLDNHKHVRLFVKLPRWFRVDTPIGSYNPDWAFVTERDEKLYFVRETKSTLDSDKRRLTENQKIECSMKHFAAIDVDYDVVTKLSEVNF